MEKHKKYITKGILVFLVFRGTKTTSKHGQKDHQSKKVTVWTKTPKFCIPQGPFLQFCHKSICMHTGLSYDTHEPVLKDVFEQHGELIEGTHMITTH